MKSKNQKQKAFNLEMEILKKENNLKEEKKTFNEILKRAVNSK